MASYFYIKNSAPLNHLRCFLIFWCCTQVYYRQLGSGFLSCVSKKQYRFFVKFNDFYKTKDAGFYVFLIDILPLWRWVCTSRCTLFMDILDDFEIITFILLANIAACSSSLVIVEICFLVGVRHYFIMESFLKSPSSNHSWSGHIHLLLNMSFKSVTFEQSMLRLISRSIIPWYLCIW